jgi:hypothetical protein
MKFDKSEAIKETICPACAGTGFVKLKPTTLPAEESTLRAVVNAQARAGWR